MTELRTRALELLEYSPTTGLFTWKVPRKRNQVKAGSVAGTKNKMGYTVIGIDGQTYYAHRLAWLVMHGNLPEKWIDHIDGNNLNNKIANLRLSEAHENAQNVKVSKANTSGITGVSWCKNCQKWNAYIGYKNKRVSAGYFDSLDDAKSARFQLKQKLHQFNPLQNQR